MTLEDRAKQYAEKQIKHKMAKHDIFIKEKAEEEIMKVYLAGAKETEMEFEKSLLEKGVCLQSDLDEAKEIIAMQKRTLENYILSPDEIIKALIRKAEALLKG